MAIRRPEGSTPCHDDLEYEVDLRDITLGDLVGNASGLYKVVFTMAYDYYGKGDPTYYTQERYIYLTNNVNTDCNNYVPFVINGITTQSDCDGITFSPNLNITGTSSALSYRYYLNNTVVNTNPTQANFTLPFDSNPPPASFNVTLRVCDHSLNYCEDYTQAITIDPNQVMPFSLQTTLPNGPLSLCASANSSQTYYLPNSFVVLRDGNTFSGSEAAASQNFSYTYTFLTEPPSGFSIEGNELHVAPNTEGNVSIQIDVNNGFDCVHSTYVYVSVYRISTTPL
jgi:hypothetical protein